MVFSKKQETVTFKVDITLAKALKTIPNRSAFIRSAILNALKNCCPLCQGTGTLSPAQLKHWATFASNHTIEECDQCHAMHVVCDEREAMGPNC